MNAGRVEEINIGPRYQLPDPVERVRADAGKGLIGNRYYFEEGAEPFRAGVVARRRLRSAGRRRAHFLAMLRFERFRSFMICRTALSAGTPVTPPPACVAELA